MAENSNLSSSATNSPIRVSEYLPHLLHFTLSQAVRDTPEFSSPLPLDFCAKLLQSEPQNACCCSQYHQSKQESNCCDCVCHADVAVAVREGVPVYPLYKQIASTLSESITSGTFVRENASMPGLHEDETLTLKMDEWIKMIVKMGSHLIDVLQRAKFHIDVQEPFFTQLKNGQKTVEGRCALGNYKRILPGDLLLVNRCLLLTVQAVNWYNSFYQMIEAESIEKVLPGIETIEEGVQVYRQFYSEEKEKSGGVLAIAVVRSLPQPYIILSDMLRELNVEGLSVLLGLRSTTGTVPDAVPPPRSTLMSSFSSLNRENKLRKTTLQEILLVISFLVHNGQIFIMFIRISVFLKQEPKRVMVPDGLEMEQSL
ncbi:uncharacterized protein LOC131060393 isoform X3 [Cryptomeria japonica]|uniref:uncharacterized protein LOC131060393 isoform X3 n=1 Tax=Cryptomeria japonica TaxID=3369 RepID=UPI0027DA5823|nr:uncharacterized protein LOC131060393 isoform X3 [Cryptomeria japonica]